MSAVEVPGYPEPIDVTVDAKGRVPLAGFGLPAGARYRVELLGDGSDRLVLTPLPAPRLRAVRS